jgi:hypothetical protein
MDLGLAVAAAPASGRVGFREGLARMHARAQDAGAVRGDVSGDELIALLTGASVATRMQRGDAALLGRVMGVIQDGLRARPCG